jgi:hypothetical protein
MLPLVPIYVLGLGLGVATCRAYAVNVKRNAGALIGDDTPLAHLDVVRDGLRVQALGLRAYADFNFT